MSENKDTKQEVANKEADEGRREALKKLGKYAYTAPVVLSLLSPKNADAEFPALPSFPQNP
jgi:hypothetical protein